MDESPNVLEIIQDILETDRSFYQMLRFLDGGSRNQLVATHMRNTASTLALMRMFMTQPQQTTMVLNIPLNTDASGNFFDPVPVVPTQAQIAAATETHQSVPPHTTCAICQDEVTCATRLRACGHDFHSSCIYEWFRLNPRCPVCRHDIRDLQPANNTR